MGSEFERRTVPSAVETMMLVCRPTSTWSEPEKDPWPRPAKDAVYRFIVIWLGVTDGYVHGRLSSERERRST